MKHQPDSISEDHASSMDEKKKKLLQELLMSVPLSTTIVCGVKSPISLRVLKKFFYIQHLYDDGKFKSFKTECNRVRTLWHSRSTFDNKKGEMLSDLHCMCLGLRYKHVAINEEKNASSTLSEINYVLKHTSDQSMFEIFILNRKARVQSTKHCIEEAYDYLKDASSRCSVRANCIEDIETDISKSTVSLYETESRRPREERKRQVGCLNTIREKICSLDEGYRECYTEAEACTVFIAGLTLMNINEDGRDLGKDDITQDDISEAQQYFNDSDAFWDKLPNKWKAVILLGKAKLSFLKNDLEQALKFIKDAKKSAQEVHYIPAGLQENIDLFSESMAEVTFKNVSYLLYFVFINHSFVIFFLFL